ncbi:hypothetical protein M8494_11985 [Serratia ureilytica]
MHRLIDSRVGFPPNNGVRQRREIFSGIPAVIREVPSETSADQTAAGLQQAMKQTVTRKVGLRAFMRREVIFQEIAGWRGEVSEIGEQLQTYLDRFERQAINVLQ